MTTIAIRQNIAMSPIQEEDIHALKNIGGYLGGAGVFGIAMRFLWKVLNKFTSAADSNTAKNKAEETLWARLQSQIEHLQKSEIEMEKRIEELRAEVSGLREENAKLMTQNIFYKQKIDEQIEIIANLETMINNVHITDKRNADQ